MSNFKILALFLSLVINLIHIYAQDSLWIKTYGGIASDDAIDIQWTNDQGLVLAGGTHSFGAGSQDFWLLKTNKFGDTLWTKTYGRSFDDRAYSVKQTLDYGYIITGYTTDSLSNKDIWLIKTDSVGVMEWQQKYDKNFIDWGLSVQQTFDAGFILAGFTQNQNGTDIRLIKTDAYGDTNWTKTFGGNLNDWSGSVQQTADSGYILTGFTENIANGNRDVWLLKTDCGGDILWAKKYGGTQDDWGRVVKKTIDGGYIIGGVTHSFGSGGSDIWLIKTNATGDSVWSKVYGGNADDWVYTSVQQTLDLGYIIAGGTYSYGAGDSDAWLIKTDQFGDTLWTKSFGGINFDNASAVIQSPDGGYILTGGTKSFGVGDSDAWIIKTDSLGNTVIISSINKTVLVYPQSIELLRNYPNPFNNRTTIAFSTTGTFKVDITIYDVLGRKVKDILSQKLYSGLHEVAWDGTNQSGKQVASGIYFSILTSYSVTNHQKNIQSAKLVLFK